MQLSNEQQSAIDSIINNDSNLFFLTGKAGTGKSTVTRELIFQARQNGLNVVVTAPTGIAALNVGGETLHRFLALNQYSTLQRPHAPRSGSVVRSLDILIVDEASMLRADMLDMLHNSLSLARDNFKPFGGIKVVLVGDLSQLPPVVTREDKDFINSRYQSEFFFSSEIFQRCSFSAIELSHIYRQADDRFVRLLNHCRQGTKLDQIIGYLNAEKSVKRDEDATGAILCATNKRCAEINESNLAKLDSETFTFYALVLGDIKQSEYPAAERLDLKAGARVMVIKNIYDDRMEMIACNGDLAYVVSVHENIAVDVKLDRNNQVVTLQNETWEKAQSSTKNGELVKEPTGSFTQIPLTLAWAITIHKSQGQTIDNVCVDLSRRMFSHGQLYVALSRCTSLAGLQILGKAEVRDVIQHPLVTRFVNNGFTIKQEIKGPSALRQEVTFSEVAA